MFTTTEPEKKPVHGHEIQERRSLKMHRLVADALRKDPDVVLQYGIANIQRWRRQGADCSAFDEWLEILKGGPDATLPLLEETNERAIRLRQSSPFPGIVSETTRREIFAET